MTPTQLSSETREATPGPAPFLNKVETYESDFAYKSIIPDTGMKTYLSPVFQESQIEERKVRKTEINPEKDLLMARALLESEDELRKKNLDPRHQYSAGDKYKKNRKIPSSSTPVSQKSYIQGKNLGKGPESGTDKRILGKKNMHISIGEQIVSKKTSNKSFMYRMNSSFSKESSGKKTKSGKEGNLPNINKTSDADQPDGFVGKKSGKFSQNNF